MKIKLELGAVATDSITGFTGTITGRVEYLTGCHQVLLQPRCKPDGDYVESRWFDEDRVTQDALERKAQLPISNPGYDKPAPRK